MSAHRPDLTVVILNWNARRELEECLRSLMGQRFRHRVEVIVADNASSDGSREMVRQQFPGVRLIHHPRNLGFCAGNNRAVPEQPGRYVLFLNPDTVVTECALDTLVDFADALPDAGIVGPRLLNPDGTLQYSCRRFPSLGAGFFRNTPLGRLFPRNHYTTDYLMSDWDHAEPRDVDWVSGAALLIRREALEQTGGFDEQFFMYCEDVDLCWRAGKLGWRVVYCPESVIYHIIGRSSDQVPARATWLFHRAMYLFYRKHYARATHPLLRPLVVPGLFARAAGQIARYRWRRLKRMLSNRRAA